MTDVRNPIADEVIQQITVPYGAMASKARHALLAAVEHGSTSERLRKAEGVLRDYRPELEKLLVQAELMAKLKAMDSLPVPEPAELVAAVMAGDVTRLGWTGPHEGERGGTYWQSDDGEKRYQNEKPEEETGSNRTSTGFQPDSDQHADAKAIAAAIKTGVVGGLRVLKGLAKLPLRVAGKLARVGEKILDIGDVIPEGALADGVDELGEALGAIAKVMTAGWITWPIARKLARMGGGMVGALVKRVAMPAVTGQRLGTTARLATGETVQVDDDPYDELKADINQLSTSDLVELINVLHGFAHAGEPTKEDVERIVGQAEAARTRLPQELSTVRLVTATDNPWTQYTGRHGGKGWINSQTKEVRYQDNAPAAHESNPEGIKDLRQLFDTLTPKDREQIRKQSLQNAREYVEQINREALPTAKEVASDPEKRKALLGRMAKGMRVSLGAAIGAGRFLTYDMVVGQGIKTLSAAVRTVGKLGGQSGKAIKALMGRVEWTKEDTKKLLRAFYDVPAFIAVEAYEYGLPATGMTLAWVYKSKHPIAERIRKVMPEALANQNDLVSRWVDKIGEALKYPEKWVRGTLKAELQHKRLERSMQSAALSTVDAEITESQAEVLLALAQGIDAEIKRMAEKSKQVRLGWTGPHEGERGGTYWQDERGEKRYQDEKPGDEETKSQPSAKRAPPGSQLEEKVKSRLRELGMTGTFPPADVPMSDIKIADLSAGADELRFKPLMSWNQTTKSGRVSRQYRYTSEFHERNAEEKFNRVMAIEPHLPSIKERLSSKMQDKSVSPKVREAAAIASIIAETGLRPTDSDESVKHGHYGVGSLLAGHVRFENGEAHLDFIGKEGVRNKAIVRDKTNVDFLRAATSGKTVDAFVFASANSTDAGAILKEASQSSGGSKDVKLKDLRTIKATQTAQDVVRSFDGPPPPLTGESKKDVKTLAKAILAMSAKVAEVLNNTATMARDNYIHPRVFREWQQKLAVAS